ncbi:MAG: poly(A) polymerase, partial [Leptolyngbya sp. SIO1D8]|nr:poly(A) polymerase [Leptolyngbya sp. SIO1D8]
ETTVLAKLLQCDRPSKSVHLLRQYDTATLVLISVRYPQNVGYRIWQYLTTWTHVKAPLNGHDLRQLGYPPGPHYRIMLEALLVATLDGEVTDKFTGTAFIHQKYPLSAPISLE